VRFSIHNTLLTAVLIFIQDAKYTLEIMDHSIQYETHGLKVVIFRPMEEMPRLSGVADVVLIRNAKVCL
jgi:hypothetical protein